MRQALAKRGKSICCKWCEAVLDRWEVENPPKSDSGDVLCDECWGDEYRETCDRCCESSEKKDFGKVGNLIAVLDNEVAPCGFYRVLSWPFYTLAMIGQGWLHMHALKFVGPLHGTFQSDGPCVMLCAECSRKIAAARAVHKEHP